MEGNIKKKYWNTLRLYIRTLCPIGFIEMYDKISRFLPVINCISFINFVNVLAKLVRLVCFRF